MMTPAAQALVVSLGYDYPAFLALWVQDLIYGNVLAEIQGHTPLETIDVSAVPAATVDAILAQDINDVELNYLILSRLRAGGAGFPVFTESGLAAFKTRDVTNVERLAMVFALIGGTTPNPNQIFGYTPGDDLTKLGATFTRASLATYRDVDGVIRNAPHNYVAWSDNLIPWASYLGPTVIDYQTVDFSTATDPVARVYIAGSYTDIGSFVFQVQIRCLSGTQKFRLGIYGNSSPDLTATTTWQTFSHIVTNASGYQAEVWCDAGKTTGVLQIRRAWFEKNTAPSPENKFLPTTGTARFDGIRDNHYQWDVPSGTYKRTLLLEGQRTNLCLRSQDFTNAAWLTQGVTILNTGNTAPDGTLTGQAIAPTDTNPGDHLKYIQSGAATTGTCCSVWAKPKGSDYLYLAIFTEIWSGAKFNVSTGVASNVAAGITARIEAGTNGWYRCSIYLNHTSITPYIGVSPSNAAATALTYTPVSGNEDVYIWGAQMEAGAFPSSYIPTTSAAVTRAADSLSFPYAAKPQEGTMYVKGIELGSDFNSALAWIGQYTPVRWGLYQSNNGTPFYTSFHSSVSGGHTNGNTIGARQEHRLTLSALGVVQTNRSENAGAEATGSASTELALEPSWVDPTLRVGFYQAGYQAFFAYSDIRIFKGTRDLAYCRSSVTPPVDPDLLFSYSAGDSLLEKGGTYSGASARTYRDKFGYIQTLPAGKPRDAHYQWNPASGAYEKSFLSEPQRTNLLTWSENAENAAWSNIGAAVIPNDTAGPDGSMSADTWPCVGPNSYQLYQILSLSSGVYTFSRFVKAGTAAWIYLDIEPACRQWFHAASGFALGSHSGSAWQSANVENIGNGWFRVSVTCSTETPGYATIGVCDADGTTAIAASGSIHLGGAQLEEGTFPTSYIKTTSAAVTRAADGLSFPNIPPQPMTVYIRGVGVGYTATYNILYSLGSIFVSPALWIQWSPAAFGGSMYLPAADGSASAAQILQKNGDAFESRTTIGVDGSMTESSTNNGGSEVIGPTGPPGPIPPAWGPAFFYLNDGWMIYPGTWAFFDVRVFKGIRDLAYCRSKLTK